MIMTVGQIIHQLEKFDRELPVFIAEYAFKNDIGDDRFDHPVCAIVQKKTPDQFHEEFVRIYSYLNLDGN